MKKDYNMIQYYVSTCMYKKNPIGIKHLYIIFICMLMSFQSSSIHFAHRACYEISSALYEGWPHQYIIGIAMTS